jgi:hypothetical protein
MALAIAIYDARRLPFRVAGRQECAPATGFKPKFRILASFSNSSSSSIFDLESVWIWECGVEGRCLRRPGGRQAAHLQRVEDEDEFENENDLVAATLRYYDDEHEEESSISSINPREVDRDLCREQLFGIVHLLPIGDRFRH